MVTPVAMPTFGTQEGEFRAVRPLQVSRSEGRQTASLESYYRFWIARYTIVPLTDQQAWELSVFLSDRAPFVATHPKKPRPLAYRSAPLSGTRAAGGAFNGDAVLNSLADRASPEISGLPANFIFTKGDLVEFRQSDTVRSLHMVSTAITGNSSGVVTLPLDYPIPSDFTTSATVHLERPGCVMTITSDTQGVQPTVNRGFGFDAEEVFLP
ncbi:MAG: hypothetical protein AAF739_00270 [Pseudomonadota bacterium]